MTEEKTEKTQSRPVRVLKTIGKVLAYGAALIIAVLLIAHFAWKYSGSNKWELAIDGDKVKIYTLKAPGNSFKDIKAVTRVKSRLSPIVAAMVSSSGEDCAAWAPSCKSLASIQPWNSNDMTYIHLYRLTFPKPFRPREFLLNARVTQDPATKAVLLEFIALPDKLPRDPCCFRVEKMHNRWRFTPLQNGEVEVELQTGMDPGLPYFMVNRMNPGYIYRMFGPLQQWFEKDKWQHTTYAHIKEV